MSNYEWLRLIQFVFIVLVVLIVIALILKSTNGLIWARTTYQLKIHKQDSRFKFERAFGTKVRLLIQKGFDTVLYSRFNRAIVSLSVSLKDVEEERL